MKWLPLMVVAGSTGVSHDHRRIRQPLGNRPGTRQKGGGSLTSLSARPGGPGLHPIARHAVVARFHLASGNSAQMGVGQN